MTANNDTLLISNPYNVRYLCGFTGGEGYLLVMPHKKVLFVDSRYGVRAHDECTDTEIIVDNEMTAAINSVIRREGISVVAVEGKYITYDTFKKLSESIEAHIEACQDDTDMLRVLKSKSEIALIKKAEDIGCDAFDHILSFIKPGVSEREIAFELEYHMRKNGADGLSFDTIAASGINSSCPHASVSDKKINNGDLVTLDFGCIFKGYCSDMTRTIAVGHIDDEQKKVYDIVLAAQLAAIDSIKPGITGREADAFARNIIESSGYGKCFGHGLGHGVGLFIHEAPRLSVKSEDILEPGMVFSVEPGIYIDGRFGIRIEDVVCLEEDGVVNLTKSPKELIVL